MLAFAKFHSGLQVISLQRRTMNKEGSALQPAKTGSPTPTPPQPQGGINFVLGAPSFFALFAKIGGGSDVAVFLPNQ